MTHPPPSGTVYGVLMNCDSEWRALGAAMAGAPYKGEPRAPVLYIKPANTFSADGDRVVLPTGCDSAEAWASIGLVLGRALHGAAEDEALAAVAGARLVIDWTLPHPDPLASFYRPPVRLKAWDGALGLGSAQQPLAALALPLQALRITLHVDGQHHALGFDALRRPPARLLAEVSQFMRLDAGDMLLIGAPLPRPRVQAGQTLQATAEGLGDLTQTLVRGEAA